MGYHRYTKEQIQETRDIDTVELLIKLGFQLKRHSGDEYYLIEHDSFKVSHKKGWYWNSLDMGGNAVDFLMKHPDFNLSFTGAVKLARETMGLDRIDIPVQTRIKLSEYQKVQEPTQSFSIPRKAKNNLRIIEYLTKVRYVNQSIVDRFIADGFIYESAKTHNVVFLGFDFEAKAKSGFLRGTGSKRFAGMVKGSDKSYCTRIEDGSEDLHVYESPIDGMSYMSMFGTAGNHLMMYGVSSIALEEYLKIKGNYIKNIWVRTDNDEAGQTFADKVYSKYSSSHNVFIALPENKDYNVDLKMQCTISKSANNNTT